MEADGTVTTTSIVVMGVSGSGKSTVADLLVQRLGWKFAEGDDFHPPANVEKMHSGHPLDDDDRWPWLRTLAEWIGEQERAGAACIVTCSALKRRYRDLL
ncbi:MAG TPA: gluconokinase, GntK/IdnK-type, partial [Blastococcus sp.]